MKLIAINYFYDDKNKKRIPLKCKKTNLKSEPGLQLQKQVRSNLEYKMIKKNIFIYI